MPDASKDAALTVHFDGQCPLCAAEIRHYKALDENQVLHFVDVADPHAAAGPHLDRCDALKRFHVRSANGELISGARAFTALWRHLPGWRWLAIVMRIPGVILLAELAYRGFLPIRPYLSSLYGRLTKKRAVRGR